MLNTTKAFLLSLLQIFIVYIVLGNFLGWSGGAIDVTGYQVDWQNSYIGFESFTSAIDDFNNYLKTNWYYTSISNGTDWLRELANAITLYIPQMITKLANGTGLNALDFIVWVLKVIFQPIIILGYLILVFAFIISYIYGFVLIFFRFVGGKYNCYATSTADVWDQWSYLSSEWDWSNILSAIIV